MPYQRTSERLSARRERKASHQGAGWFTCRHAAFGRPCNTLLNAHSRAPASRGTYRETLEFRCARRVRLFGSIRRKERSPGAKPAERRKQRREEWKREKAADDGRQERRGCRGGATRPSPAAEVSSLFSFFFSAYSASFMTWRTNAAFCPRWNLTYNWVILLISIPFANGNPLIPQWGQEPCGILIIFFMWKQKLTWVMALKNTRHFFGGWGGFKSISMSPLKGLTIRKSLHF